MQLFVTLVMEGTQPDEGLMLVKNLTPCSHSGVGFPEEKGIAVFGSVAVTWGSYLRHGRNVKL